MNIPAWALEWVGEAGDLLRELADVYERLAAATRQAADMVDQLAGMGEASSGEGGRERAK